jgi:hypothetical protein
MYFKAAIIESIQNYDYNYLFLARTGVLTGPCTCEAGALPLDPHPQPFIEITNTISTFNIIFTCSLESTEVIKTTPELK